MKGKLRGLGRPILLVLIGFMIAASMIVYQQGGIVGSEAEDVHTVGANGEISGFEKDADGNIIDAHHNGS